MTSRFSPKSDFPAALLAADLKRSKPPPIRPKIERTNREMSAVSCWHMNTHESAAMWGLYMKADQGIAVRSTFARFVRAVAKASQPVHIGVVHYIDYTAADVGLDIASNSALCKRKSFEHERELRAVVTIAPLWAEQPGEKLPRVIAVPVDLSSLMEVVYVAPSAPEWELDVVRRVVERYGLSAPVIQSDLNKGPIY